MATPLGILRAKLQLGYGGQPCHCLWGPSPVASLGGSRNYITFIDDSSRKVWVYFLKNKSDVFETFKKWKAMLETETCLKVKCLRSDNGG